jgi:methylmalonyl-CoA mutase C-terminal domain/subunit
MSNRIPRIALGMLGLDVHTKGIRTLTIRLRDEGFEVIYLGEHLTTEQLVRSAIAEDVDCIGVSFSSAAYVDHCRGLLKEMGRHEASDIPVVVGGLIHADDHPVLRELGIAGIFGPGSTTKGIAESLRALVRESAATT